MIILDTHAWIWYVSESPNLSQNALNKINENDICGVSAISCWEVAMLVSKGKLILNIDLLDWIEKALNYDKIQLIPLSPEISVKSTTLPTNFHKDPADRIITSTAIVNNCELITKDEKIRGINVISTIW